MHRHVIGLTIWLGVFYAVLSARRQGSNPITAFLVSKRIAYLGRISYSLYMVHMLVLVGWIWAVRRVGVPVEVQYFLLPAGCLGLAIAALESPSARDGRRRLELIDLLDRSQRFAGQPRLKGYERISYHGTQDGLPRFM